MKIQKHFQGPRYVNSACHRPSAIFDDSNCNRKKYSRNRNSAVGVAKMVTSCLNRHRTYANQSSQFHSNKRDLFWILYITGAIITLFYEQRYLSLCAGEIFRMLFLKCYLFSSELKSAFRLQIIGKKLQKWNSLDLLLFDVAWYIFRHVLLKKVSYIV